MIYNLIGDVHCNWRVLKSLVANIPRNEQIIQVGDLGIGFNVPIIGERDYSDPKEFAPNFRFIRGNHDNPAACQLRTEYLGDYGYNKPLKIFFVGGGFSIDRDKRVEGMDWWRDEELSYEDFQKMLNLYEKVKPDFVISHEAPSRLCNKNSMISHLSVQEHSRTSQALDIMLDIHWPKRWVFGHYHRHLGAIINGTHFICLDTYETLKIDV